jgi:hypothetical protein
MNPGSLALGATFAAALAMAGCGPAGPSGPASFEIGTGDGAFVPVTDGQALPITLGSQGGIHVWVAGRVTGLGDLVDVHAGLRDPDTGESVSYLSLEWMVHPQVDGDAQSFSGLAARFADDDPTHYAGRTFVLWATASGGGTTLQDERTITVTAP